MPVEVVIHPDTLQTYFEHLDPALTPNLDRLRRDFIRYKESNHSEYPGYFGKDTVYLNPEAACRIGLSHIHLLPPGRTFPPSLPQWQRACRKGDPNADIALVYCQGVLFPDRYCFLAILHPEAHALAREHQRMAYLCRIAEAWQDEN